MVEDNAPTVDEPTVEIFENMESAVETKTYKSINVNFYVIKKTVAQGLLNISLLISIVPQLNYHTYYFAFVCHCISIIIQVLVIILILLNFKCNINKTAQQPRAELMNNLITFGVFVITMLNIIASNFNDFDNPNYMISNFTYNPSFMISNFTDSDNT